MVAWIGVDDTDSLQGMCTTFLAAEIVRELTTDYDLVGYPRLVRLNPNVPWKTRGNGAICVRFGHGAGRRTLIGERPGVTMMSGASAPASHASSRADPNSRSRLPTPDSASFPASPQPACTGMPCGGLSRRKKHWPPSDRRASFGSTRTVGESSARWLRPPGGPATEHTRFSRTGTNLGGEHLETSSRTR